MARFVPPITQLAKDDLSGSASGWGLYFYESGGLVEKDTYSDSTLTTPNSNPVVADSAGRFGPIFLGSDNYRVILKDDLGVTKWDADPVEGTAGSSGSVDEKTSAYTVTIGDATKTIAVDATSGAITITLPPAATAGDGFEITIKKTDSSANAVTVDADGSELIDGAATYVLSLQYQSAIFRSDATGWHVLAATRVKTADIDASAVTTAKIADDAITSAKLDTSLFRGYIDGLTTAHDTDADHDIAISPGAAMSSDGSVFMELAATLTKQIDATWAAGDDAGGMAEGITVGNDTWYHLFLLSSADGATVDAGWDTSVTAANLLADTAVVAAGLTKARMIWSHRTNGSANIRAYTQLHDECLWAVQSDDVNSDNPGTSAVTPTLLTPLGIKCWVKATVRVFAGTTSNITVLITSPDQTDTAAATTAFTLEANSGAAARPVVFGQWRTNTSSQIRYRFSASGASDNMRIQTIGFQHPRGRNA